MASESPQVYADKFCWIQKGVKGLVTMSQGSFWRSERFIKAVAWNTANLLKVFLLLGGLSSLYQEHKYRVFLLRKEVESSWLLLISDYLLSILQSETKSGGNTFLFPLHKFDGRSKSVKRNCLQRSVF